MFVAGGQSWIVQGGIRGAAIGVSTLLVAVFLPPGLHGLPGGRTGGEAGKQNFIVTIDCGCLFGKAGSLFRRRLY